VHQRRAGMLHHALQRLPLIDFLSPGPGLDPCLRFAAFVRLLSVVTYNGSVDVFATLLSLLNAACALCRPPS
jgi:hypothetical protein